MDNLIQSLRQKMQNLRRRLGDAIRTCNACVHGLSQSSRKLLPENTLVSFTVNEGAGPTPSTTPSLYQLRLLVGLLMNLLNLLNPLGALYRSTRSMIREPQLQGVWA